MASLNFDHEKKLFSNFYNKEYPRLESAKDSYIALVKKLLTESVEINLSKIDGRVKVKEEALKKFSVKYQKALESRTQAYEIRNHITDLIGIRAVFLYEDELEKAALLLAENFEVMELTNKSSTLEGTGDHFGYKGLHMDLRLSHTNASLKEYSPYATIQFELQLRTIIQDSWSVLDHNLMYKKSVPIKLRRRINTLSALFELADKEFREIRDSTQEFESQAVQHKDEHPLEKHIEHSPQGGLKQKELNVFNFLKIVSHFFKNYEFLPYKVDGFVHEITQLAPTYQKGKLHKAIVNYGEVVGKYRTELSLATGKEQSNPFTIIRHCLYLSDKEIFMNVLTDFSRDNFEAWLSKNAVKLV